MCKYCKTVKNEFHEANLAKRKILDCYDDTAFTDGVQNKGYLILSTWNTDDYNKETYELEASVEIENGTGMVMCFEVRKKINYCPMCGRKLVKEDM